MIPQIIKVEQGTDAWFKMRMGVITASKAYDLLPAKRGGGFKEARRTYMAQLISEVCTGEFEQMGFLAPLEWGKMNEIPARAAYAFETGQDVTEGGFIYSPDKREGCSPDLLITGRPKGGEVKCPWSTVNHIKFLMDGEVKDEWEAQMQFQLRVSGFETWDFASYDPRMKKKILGIKTYERDEKMQSLFNEVVPQFIYDMDKELEKIGIKFGSQWTDLSTLKESA